MRPLTIEELVDLLNKQFLDLYCYASTPHQICLSYGKGNTQVHYYPNSRKLVVATNKGIKVTREQLTRHIQHGLLIDPIDYHDNYLSKNKIPEKKVVYLRHVC